MRRLLAAWRRLRNVFGGNRLDRELNEELATFFELHVDEHRRRGLSEADARLAAQRALGNTVRLRETHREARGVPWLEMVTGDLRYALRTFRRSPGFALVIVLSLAVGIGANTALFSVANAVMLRTLAVPDPEHLHIAGIQSRFTVAQRFSYPLYQRLAPVVSKPDRVAAASRVARMRFMLEGRAESTRGAMQLATPTFFAVLGVRPALGRFFTDEENQIGGPHLVAVISHRFWRQQLASAPDAIGRSIAINNATATIIGIGPVDFNGIWLEFPVDVWLPVVAQPDVRYIQNFTANDADFAQPWPPQMGLSWLEILLRAERSDGPDGAALAAAYRAAVRDEARQISDPHERDLSADRQLQLKPFAQGFSTLRDRFRTPLFALLAMVGLLLLLACANTANLLLARAAARQREIAVRLSIGASRRRLIAQLLTESLVLGLFAGGLGLLVAPAASELLVRWTLTGDTTTIPFSVGIDTRVLAFTLLLSVATSVAFGFVPAKRGTALRLTDALRDGGRGMQGASTRRAAGTLVVAQVMLSVVLLVAAGLFARSLRNLQLVDLGFEPGRIISASLNLQGPAYEAQSLPALYERLVARITALPGVQSAALATCGVMTGCRVTTDGLFIDGYAPQRGEQVIVQENRVSAGYFATLGMRLVMGREFDARDASSSPLVAIVNEAMAAKYFHGRNPLGKRIGYEQPDTEIIGIVRNARLNTVREPPVPMAFYPLGPGMPGTRASVVEVRAAGDPHTLATTLRTAIADVDRSVPVDRVAVVADNASDSIRQERLVAGLAIIFAVVAIALASLGLYGLMSYGVRQRRAELAVRFALGAPRGRVLWAVLRECLTLTALGIAAGLVIVFAASRLVRTLLFEVTPLDPSTILFGVVVVVAVAAASGYLPARRASLVDPLVALRDE